MATEHSREDYTIGLITPLYIEQAATAAILDRKHDTPTDLELSSNDSNIYICGEVGEHNVVIAGLASGYTGSTSALSTALPMLDAFPNVKVGLLVGIGAGIPNENDDIRLGDVVVSLPKNSSSGVFQFDFGKAGADGWQKGGSLASPPMALLKAVGKMRSDHETEGSKIQEIIEGVFQQKPMMAQNYKRPAPELDRFFNSSYKHIAGSDCTKCGPENEISRLPRDSTKPTIHYGIIASGASVVKDADLRDKIARMEDGCICLEMEAAGLMNNFPCLVIRGISDYGDSHKNDHWQRYASIAAAACAKEILSRVQKAIITSTKRVRKSYQTRDEDKHTSFWRALYEVGGPYDERKNRNPVRVPGTCQWFTDHDSFQQWRCDPSAALLYVSGDPGCGKSVLSRYLIDEVLSDPNNTETGLPYSSLCYFFFKDGFPDSRTAAGAMASIVYQLSRQKSNLLSDPILKDFATQGTSYLQSFERLWNILILVANAQNDAPIICVLDALDECEDSSRHDILTALIKYLSKTPANVAAKLKFLITSRPYPSVESTISEMKKQSRTIHLKGEGETERISYEIDLVIRNSVDRMKRPSLTDEDREKLYKYLTEVPHRTYLWVHLAISELESSPNLFSGNVDALWPQIGDSVDSVYENILSKSSDAKRAETILQIVIAAYGPRTVSEIYVALRLSGTFMPKEDPFTTLLSVEQMLRIIRDACGLFVTEIHSKVHLIHQTAKEFLLSGGRGERTSFITEQAQRKTWKHSFDSEIAHSLMAKVCLRYLQYETSTPEGEKFSQYCKYYLCAHMFEGGSQITAPMARDTIDLLEGQLGGWWDPIVTHMPWFNPKNSLCRPDSEYSLLARTAYLGIPSLIKQLLANGTTKVKSKTPSQWSALHLAAANGHEEAIKVLLHAGADVNCRGPHRLPVLWVAIKSGSEKAVSLLIDNGADVNRIGTKEEDFATAPLLCASEMGRVDLVKLLLQKKANPNNTYLLRSSPVPAPITHAINHRDCNLVEVLLDYGCSVNKPVGRSDIRLSTGVAPLILAIKTQDTKVVKLLIKHRADVNKASYDGSIGANRDTPLAYAVHYAGKQLCKLLLDNGADVNTGNNEYGRPLPRAIRLLKYDTARLLVECGARFDTCIVTDSSPGRAWLTLKDVMSRPGLIPRNLDLETVDAIIIRLFLFDAGISFARSADAMALSHKIIGLTKDNERDERQTSPVLLDPSGCLSGKKKNDSLLVEAIRARAFDVAKVLVLQGTRADDISKNNTSKEQLERLLTIAAREGDLSLIEQVLNAGAAINIGDFLTGRTALSFAMSYGYEEDCDIIEISTERENNFKEIARCIFVRGGDRDLADYDGRTPETWAKIYHNPWYEDLFKPD